MLRSLIIAMSIIAVAGVAAYILIVPRERAAEPQAAEAENTEAVRDEVAVATAEEMDIPPQSEFPVLPSPRNVTPPGIHPGPVRRYEPQRQPDPAPEEQQAEPESRIFPRVVVEEAGVLRADGRLIRLEGISAPSPETTCTDTAGTDWPCGRAAMAALRLLVRNRTVECEIAGEDGDTLNGTCSVGGRDLAEWLVQQGWAEPADGTLFSAQSTTARDEARGMFAASRGEAPPPVRVPAP